MVCNTTWGALCVCHVTLGACEHAEYVQVCVWSKAFTVGPTCNNLHAQQQSV